MLRRGAMPCLVFLLLLSVPASSQATDPPCGVAPEREPHPPIAITSNVDLTVPDLTGLTNGVRGGSGTQADPYVISGWHIQAAGRQPIVITNTDVHIVLRDLTLEAPERFSQAMLAMRNVENVRMENVRIEGEFDSAGQLASVRGLVAESLVLDGRLREGSDTQAHGIGIGGTQARFDQLEACDVASAFVAGQGLGPGAAVESQIEIHGVRTSEETYTRLSLTSVERFDMTDAVGKIALHVGLTDQASASVRDSDLVQVDFNQYESGHAEVVVESTRVWWPDGLYINGMSFHADSGSVVVRNSTFEGFPKGAVDIRMPAVEFSGNAFLGNSWDNDDGVHFDSQVAIYARCEAVAKAACGPFRFDRNDLIRGEDDPSGRGIWFDDNGTGARLTGEGNFFSGGEPIRARESVQRTSAPNLLVQGPVSLTDHARSPVTEAGAAAYEDIEYETPGIGVVAAVATIAFAMGRRRDPPRRGTM